MLCFLLSIANFSGERFLEEYEQTNKIEVQTECTPLQFVAEMNEKHFKGRLRVGQVAQKATDAYSKGTIYLSTQTIYTNSVASFTIIAHELGHALQDQEGKKLKSLTFLRRFGRGIALLLGPCIIAGGILAILEYFLLALCLLGAAILIFILSLYVKLKTISIEKDASVKAVAMLGEYLTANELKISKKLLKDAKLTYWADFLRIFLWWTALSRKTKLFN